MNQKKSKTRWQKINHIILILHIIVPVWALALMMTSAISGKLLLIAAGASLLLGAVYKLVQKLRKGRWLLIIARVAAISACIVFYLPMLILMNFSRSKPLYTLKRLDYIHGVYGGSDCYQQLLPSELPEVCEDYTFRTQGTLPAQDYHASSYLMFHTDTATLDAYAQYFGQMDCTRLENGTENEYDPEEESENAYAQGKIEWFCGQMRLRQSFQDNLDNAVLYWFDSRYPKAVLLNYETGLVAVLT